MSIPTGTSLLGPTFHDELMWSYEGRLRERYPLFDFKLFIGAEPSCRKAFPTSLAKMANAFAYPGAPDVTALIEHHTFFKFAVPEISKARAQQLAESMAVRTFPSFAPDHLIHQRDFRLRLCPHCLAEDAAQYGTAYWHRVHQLPDLRLCPTHGTALWATEVMTGCRKFVAAAEAVLTSREMEVANPAVQQVLARAYEALANHPEPVYGGQIRDAVQQLLVERGLYQSRRVSASLVEQLRAKFGREADGFIPVDFPDRLSNWLTVPQLAVLCATITLPFADLLTLAGRVRGDDRPDRSAMRLQLLEAKVKELAPVVAMRLKRETGQRVSPWALANALKPKLGPGFASNYSWKPGIRSVLRVHAESREQFRSRLARVA